MSLSSAASRRTRRPEDASVVGTVGDNDAPIEDEAKVGHEDAPHEDEDEHDGEAHEHREIGAEIIGVDGKVQFETATAEILGVLNLALLGLCGTTLAIWPNVLLVIDFCPSRPTVNALNMLCVVTGGFGLAMASDEICRG